MHFRCIRWLSLSFVLHVLWSCELPNMIKIDYCNAMWCVCCVPIDYEVMFRLCMILICWFMFLQALRCGSLLWPSDCVYLQKRVFMLDSGFIPHLFLGTSDRNVEGRGCVVPTMGKTVVLVSLLILVLLTTCALLNAIVCCLQLNTVGWQAG